MCRLSYSSKGITAREGRPKTSLCTHMQYRQPFPCQPGIERQTSPQDARSLAGRMLAGPWNWYQKETDETLRNQRYRCLSVRALSKCRGPRPEASWLTIPFFIIFFNYFLSLLSFSHLLVPPPFTHIGRYTASGTRRAIEHITVAYNLFPLLEKEDQQLSTPRHGSTSLPKCASDPLEHSCFSPSFLFLSSPVAWRLGW